MTMAAAIADRSVPPLLIDQEPAVSLAFAEKPHWLESVEVQVDELRRMSFGWDAFGAGPLRDDVLWFAVFLLETVMSDDTPPPHITPMSHEGIMLEWHGDGIDLEIEIERPGEAYVEYEDSATNTRDSWTVRTNMGVLASPLQRLTG